MAKLMVLYPRHEGCGFDRDYYMSTHLQIVTEAWGEQGMTGADIEWPFDDSQPFVCIAAVEFVDQAAIDKTLTAPATQGVMADLPNFTDIQPTLYRTA